MTREEKNRTIDELNAQLVEKARCIVEDLGSSILNPEQVREKLKLKKHF